MGRQFTTVALGALLLVSVGAAAPRAAKPRTIATGWRVTALAADGVRAAFVVSVTDPGSGCAGVKLWEPLRTRRPTPASLSGRGERRRGDVWHRARWHPGGLAVDGRRKHP